MVDHYVLLYMGCILSIVHRTIFLRWLLRDEVAGMGTSGQGRGFQNLLDLVIFLKKKMFKKNKYHKKHKDVSVVLLCFFTREVKMRF